MKNLTKVNKPLVSIIIPTYNREDFLPDTIQSVLNQSYSSIELIVLDDGSTDNTIELLRGYGSNLKWCHHPNMGEALTVNKGLRMAKGDIFCVLCSDDILYENAVHDIVRFMLHNPQIDVVYPDWYKINKKNKIILKKETFEYDFLKMISWHYCMPGPGTFFKKDVFINTGGRDGNFIYQSDYDFWLRAGLRFKFARIPKTLAGFRIHETSASSHGNPVRAQEHIYVMDKFFSLPGLSKEILDLKKESYFSAYFSAGSAIGRNNLKLQRKYFLKSLSLCPKNKFFEYRVRICKIFIQLFFPFLVSLWLFIKNNRWFKMY